MRNTDRYGEYHAPPATSHRQTMLIRAETVEDKAAIHEVNVLAFGQDAEAKLVDVIRESRDFINELSLVAIDHDNVIGHILFSSIQIEGPSGMVPAIALAPMAVRPEHQRTGVGTQLIRHGLERARELGHRVVVVVGHPAFYSRFGFTSAREKGIEAPFPVPDEAFMILELVEDALAGVRGTVRYSPAFDSVG